MLLQKLSNVDTNTLTLLDPIKIKYKMTIK